MLAKIYMENDRIAFEVTVDEDIEGKVYLSNDSRLGCIIMDTKNNLSITKEAQEVLRGMTDRAERCSDDVNMLDWWVNQNGVACMSWIGKKKVTAHKDIAIEMSHSAKFSDGYFVCE